jgi:hypothetical protein
VEDIIGLDQKFEAGVNLDGLTGSKLLKFEILNIHGSPIDKK